MIDVRPPQMPGKRPLNPPGQLPPPPAEPLLQPPPIIEELSSGKKPQKPRKVGRLILIWGGIVLGIIIVALAASILWFRYELSPASSNTQQALSVDITSGLTPPQIADLLEKKGVIRSSWAFRLYTRLSRSRNNLQAGSYLLKPSESTPQIVAHLEKGDVKQLKITFGGGSTLAIDKTVLAKAGFSAAEIDAALQADYSDIPVIKDKPASASLEGYLYNDTYYFSVGVSAQTVVRTAIERLNQVITDDKLAPSYTAHGLNMYQAITLASVVQAEENNPTYQATVAQIFYNRLAAGMTLGSDVTALYGARQAGIDLPSDNIAATSVAIGYDSPYNTRIHTGLPAGPIGNPGEPALKAVANPAPTGALFFLSGDDNKLYTATTEQQHEQNIIEHCQVKCQAQ